MPQNVEFQLKCLQPQIHLDKIFSLVVLIEARRGRLAGTPLVEDDDAKGLTFSATNRSNDGMFDGLQSRKTWIRTSLGNLCYRRVISTGWFTRCQWKEHVVALPESQSPIGPIGHKPNCKWQPQRISALPITSDHSDFYPPVNSHSNGKSPFLVGKSTISMAIFNSYFDITRGYNHQNHHFVG